MPTEAEWPGFNQLFEAVYPKGFEARSTEKKSQSLGSLRNYFRSLPETAQNILADDENIEIIEFMLIIPPKKRPTCDLVLKHKYFADLSPEFKLDIEGICNPNKPSKSVVNVDDDTENNILGKREATCFIDLD